MEKKQLIIHGIAEYYSVKQEKFLKEIYSDYEILFYVDNDPKKQGKQTSTGYDIYSINKVKEYPNAIIVIVSMYYIDIQKQYREAGINNELRLFPIFLRHGADKAWNQKEASSIILKNKDKFDEVYDDDKDTKNVLDMYIKTALDYNRLYTIEEFDNTNNMLKLYFSNQKFKEDCDITFIDCGAYDGDTLRKIYSRFGKRIKKYYAFEPDSKSISKLQKTINELGLKNVVEIMPYGLGEKEEVLKFKSTGSQTSCISKDGDTEIKIVSIDSLNLDIIGDVLVRMDIEGFELAALKGAKNLIKKNRPYLDICIYHKPEDMYEIPKYIRSIYDNCSIKIGCVWHSEIYAVPKV